MENNRIQAVHIAHGSDQQRSAQNRFGPDTAEKARRFHRSFPEYKETPLVELHALAKQLGVASIHVKDESFRFGLNAFKVLGGSYAIGNYIAKKLGDEEAEGAVRLSADAEHGGIWEGFAAEVHGGAEAEALEGVADGGDGESQEGQIWEAALPMLNDYDGHVYVRLFHKQLPVVVGEDYKFDLFKADTIIVRT